MPNSFKGILIVCGCIPIPFTFKDPFRPVKYSIPGGVVPLATIKSKPLKGKDQVKFLDISTNHEITVIIDNLLRIGELEGLPSDVITELQSHSYRILHSFRTKYSKLKSDQCREQFRTASKRHHKLCNKILCGIIDCILDPTANLTVNFYNGIVTVKLNTLNLMCEDPKPRSFYYWYKVFRIFNQFPNISNELRIVICRLISTLFNVINQPILTPSEMDREALEIVNRIKDNAQFVSSSEYLSETSPDHPLYEYIEEIKKTVYDISAYCNLPLSTAPSWCKDIVRVLKSVHANNKLYVFDNSSPPLSAASSGSSFIYNKKRITIPSLFASIVEEDNIIHNHNVQAFDRIVGFKQDYCINKELQDLLKSKSQYRVSTVIPQKKPKPRIIHILNNSEQDRLSYYHNLLASVLKGLMTDCTFDHKKGPTFIRNSMKDDHKISLYSFDLIAASDTFNLGLQKLILEKLIFTNHPDKESLVEMWYDIMTDYTEIKIGNTKPIKFRFGSGQAQGYLSSFPSMALEHHIIALTALRLFDNNIIPNNSVRILGDDIAFALYDQGFKFPDIYINCIHASNGDTNLDKGYIYNPNISKYSNKIAEMAKYLIINGIDITPIPFRLLTATDISEQLALLSWFSDHRSEKLTIDNLMFYLSKWSSFNYEQVKPTIGLLAHLGVPSIIKQSFSGTLGRYYGFTQYDFLILKDILIHNIVYGVINRITSNKPFEATLETLIHLTGEIKVFYQYIDDNQYVSEYNKLSYMKRKMYQINSILQELFQDYDQLSALDNETIEIVSLYLDIGDPNKTEEIIRDLTEVLEIICYNLDNIQNNQETLDNYCMTIIKVLMNFNISIDRSWSSLHKKAPTEYLFKLSDSFNNIFRDSEYGSVEAYLAEQGQEYYPIPCRESNLDQYDDSDQYDYYDDDEYEDDSHYYF